MEIISSIYQNATRIMNVLVMWIVTLATLGTSVAAAVAAADCAIGLTLRPNIGLGDGPLWGLAAVYMVALVSVLVVFGRLTQLGAKATYRELSKLRDTWQ